MAAPVQAGSLASLIDLAENPPDHPLHSLTDDLQRPLVLYIARVPGSHGMSISLPDAKNKELTEILDVFLTTMKPQQKVVTAQDVQSSLYYMHVDRPEDLELLSSFEESIEEPGYPSDEEDGRAKHATPTSAKSVRRKPLAPSRIPGLGDRVGILPEVNPYFQTYSNSATGSLQAERKPFGQNNIAEMDVGPPLPDRKLLGPRPMNQRSVAVESPALQNVPERQNVDLRRWSEQPTGTPPKLPPRPFSGGRDSAPIIPARPLAASLKHSCVPNGGHSKFLNRKPVTQATSRDLHREMKDGSNAEDLQDASLSLIRRYNNEQWTVGKISSMGPKSTVSGFGGCRHGISIHIMTHGYLRFMDAINSFAKEARTVTGMANDIRDSHSPIPAAEEQHCFQRHLQVPGQAMSRNQRHRLESTNSTPIHQRTRPSFDLPRHRHQSSDSTESNGSFTNDLHGLQSGSQKGYILRSPWEGICEFKTGVAGRSFKCKHTYTSSNATSGPGMHSAQVSELRFNLPSSKTLGSPASKSLVPGSPREAKRSSLFLHQHRRRSSSSFDAQDTNGPGSFAPKVELEERLDLTLGQEHAGGGFGGKQAKLGKLIIENEGLQMLDLIVAANMALWWRVYERVT